MGEGFFESSGSGDSAAFQHFIWALGHPETWLTFFLWFVLFIAIIKIAGRLWRGQRRLWFVLFLIIVGAALTYYTWLSQNAYDLYVQGRGHELIALQFAKRGVLILSVLSLVWIIVDWLKSKRLS